MLNSHIIPHCMTRLVLHHLH
ncbi:hypothetical protein B4U79_10612 [Dinothrombium tinctorium]|uniref:Uncharacterized protein n=1 Tax=Dinothrombium tinctorium TaxID=1965070 RepID=A0A3S3P1V0_9ACAR|nr:hypothetical protein B4U79_10066 [Dinothrombium tinctorium]RWR98892.1 hypothetical protein B4U79_10612 [Dinothrombium tinctorium]